MRVCMSARVCAWVICHAHAQRALVHVHSPFGIRK